MIKSIHAVNFKSWPKLDFEIRNGVSLILGFNVDDQSEEGCGKSAILNAMSWCLYGKTPEDLNIDDVIRNDQKSCSVKLVFDDGVIIERSRSPDKLFFSAHGTKKLSNKETQAHIQTYLRLSFETFCQSVYFSQDQTKKFLLSGQADRAKMLSEIQDLEVFDRASASAGSKAKFEIHAIEALESNKVVLGKDIEILDNKLESLQEVNNAERVALANQRKDLQEDCARMSCQALTKLTTLTTIRQEVQTQFEDLDPNCDLSEQCEEEEETFNKLMCSLSVKQDRYAAQEEDLKSLEVRYERLNGDVQQLRDKRNSLSVGAVDLKKVKNDRSVVIDKLQALEKDLVVAVSNNQSNEIRLNDIKAQHLEKSKELSDLQHTLDNPESKCHTCGAVTGHADVNILRQSINTLDNTCLQLDQSIREFPPLTETIWIDKDLIQYSRILGVMEVMVSKEEDLIREDSDVSHSLRDKEEHLKQMSDDLSIYRREIAQQEDLTELDAKCNRSLENVKNLRKLRDQEQEKRTKHEKLLNQRNFLGCEIDTLEEDMRYKTDQINHLEDQIEACIVDPVAENELQVSRESFIKSLSSTDDDIAAKNILVNSYKALKPGFKEVKSYIFQAALNELNVRANQYVQALFESTASIQFQNQDQKINATVVLDGRTGPVGSLSGGQRRRMGLAVDLALVDIVAARKGSPLGILILDEYFKDLSESSMEKCLHLLQSRKEPVLLIEHNTIFKSVVDSVFQIHFESGVSKFVSS